MVSTVPPVVGLVVALIEVTVGGLALSGVKTGPTQ